ncbi:hypothetical protein FC75_GL001910 [Lacticaseibacillus camelliae DSM 22697 = JCM 13995]|uniref:Integral membrane protein n=1 Tax=Lacticaseibacillus camelliae DSM 22697 = JCM 13995 TaxID=1423730 RepID=A0A0R2F133_9LACO|nr:hypothetical protein [Lacticaseibacillus camelliae]KRN22271.1 hypothetical protein FC75_GL001910 [Lacticaseibacillus camelliae DSM 22697 = JCM 13995]
MLYNLCAIITAISAAVSLGFALAAYWQSRASDDTSGINARYALSRSGALAIGALGLLLFHSPEYLAALAIVMTFVQLFDSAIGRRVSKFKTYGPLATGLVNAIVLALYLMQ